MTLSLTDKRVLITGASSGIGAACARQLAKAGAHLLLAARRAEKLKQLSQQLTREFSIHVDTLRLDVRDQPAIQKAFATLPAAWQSIDILINNAGLALGLEPLQQGQLDDWDAMIDTNIKGLLYVTRHVLPAMVKRNTGHIVNIGSIAGHTVYPHGVVYCATKAAVKTLSQGLRMDLYGTKIRVTAIDPGAVKTNFSDVRFKGDEKRATAVYTDMDPLTADDIADSILYCLTRPLHVNVSEMIIMPTDQAAATMIARHAKESEGVVKSG